MGTTSFHNCWSIVPKHQVSGRDGRVVRVLGVGVGASDVYRCELVAEGPPFHTTQRSANMTVVAEEIMGNTGILQ
ncbi:hypothetical protein Pcinc_004445 [Petrolisthes cinctipes]|uniref:Uncharacterized protein n=1 Tax=Petrolisthes cinctipes TaxID=88211 RepID=A0AAE1L1H9_PETCI|nr:hypothetical protein Pcinc_004445 [Petrolisthes cinctipes]